MNEFETLSYAEQCAVVEQIVRDARHAQAQTLAAALRALFGVVANGVRRPSRARSLRTAAS